MNPLLWLFVANCLVTTSFFYLFKSGDGPTKRLNANETEARMWLDSISPEMERYTFEKVEANWNYMTNITDHNTRIAATKKKLYNSFMKGILREAARFDWINFSDVTLKRRFSKIVTNDMSVLTDEQIDRLSNLSSHMLTKYSVAKVCGRPGENPESCYALEPDLNNIMASSTNTSDLTWAWRGWRDTSSKNMAGVYEEYIQLWNKVSKRNGFADNGHRWRSWYESETFQQDCEDLWLEIKPFYVQLHAYVRNKLQKKYPQVNFPKEGHIPAHLLGNMWAQSWENIEYLVRPAPSKPSMDITDELVRQNYTALKLFRLSDEFFKSLGLIQMPEPFWEKSMIEKPKDRDVVCHASAWDFFNRKDFRIKQCTTVNSRFFLTTHHEMGHVQYYLQYNDQPIQFRGGANPGFHEAIGDVVYLSVVTPEYLKSVGLMKDFVENPEEDLNFLMKQALTKVAFLPFGYLIDQWRWDVFSGATPRSQYNSKWWANRCKYQGVYPPVTRSERDFDAGSKFHVPNNTPYIRYFVAHVIQFQFHEALCKAANNTRPLHRCNLANSKEAGQKLANLMKMGSSKQWQEPFKELTGTVKMSAKPLLTYFKPLIDWLESENKGEKVGWSEECPPGSIE